jgi:hypothetical protein
MPVIGVTLVAGKLSLCVGLRRAVEAKKVRADGTVNAVPSALHRNTECRMAISWSEPDISFAVAATVWTLAEVCPAAATVRRMADSLKAC